MFGCFALETGPCSRGRTLGSGSVGRTVGTVTSGIAASTTVAGTAATTTRGRRTAASAHPTSFQPATTDSIGSRAVYATRTTSPDRMMPTPKSVYVKLSRSTKSSHPPTAAAGTTATALVFG